LSRSLFSRLIPKGKEAEFFGFYNMLGKFAAVIGPIMMGWVTLVTENARIGIFSITLLFIAGSYLLSKVDMEKENKWPRSLIHHRYPLGFLEKDCLKIGSIPNFK